MPASWREVAQRVRNWGKWGDSDQIGTLNYITPEKIIAASAEVSRYARPSKLTDSGALPSSDATPFG